MPFEIGLFRCFPQQLVVRKCAVCYEEIHFFDFRNLEYKRRPWCYVMKGVEQVQEYCDIPRCGVPVETGTFTLFSFSLPLTVVFIISSFVGFDCE